ncbi:MAG: response regulator [Gammaproteobacteria bacterium]|nr:response regulator [Gammaproteobacteria bacterium]
MSEQVSEKPEILLVDDSKVIRLSANKMLASDYVIHLAEDGQIAWEILQKNSDISVVFTDLSMPNLDGMALLDRIRKADDERIAALPVIILTGNDDAEAMKQTVFDAGATDFIAKPFQSIDLISRAKAYARLSRKVVELEKKAGLDKFTGLYNSQSLQEHGAKAFSFASRHKLYISTIYFEINKFQACFDKHGKVVAQHIISAIGKRLQAVMRDEDIAARIDVARYALILPMTSKRQTEAVIARVLETVNKLVFDTGKERIRVSFSVGYTTLDLNEKKEFNDMLAYANNALQQAKKSTQDNVVCFEGAGKLKTDMLDDMVTEQDIEKAFSHILDGDFYPIPEHHLQTVVERLTLFLQYVENKTTGDISGDDITQ